MQYAQAYVTQTHTAQTTPKTLWDKFIVHYGLPNKILLDQDRNFESQLVADLCKLMRTQKLQTSPYHLHANGQCESFNSTLIGMLGMLSPEKKSEWKKHTGALVHTRTVPRIQLQGSAPITSCIKGNPASQWMSP